VEMSGSASAQTTDPPAEMPKSSGAEDATSVTEVDSLTSQHKASCMHDRALVLLGALQVS